MKRQFVFLAMMAAIGTANAQFFDDFNRANSTNMGANWTEQNGDFQILNNRAQLINAPFNPSYMTVNGVSSAPISTVVSADVFQQSASLSYVALEFGIANSGQMLFTKMQDNNSDGLFDTVYFYYGNNGSGFTGSGSYALNSPTASAHVSAYMTGTDTLHFDVDSNFDSIVDQSFTATGISALTLGTGVGVGIFGDGAVDNYRVGAVPEPMSIAALALGSLVLVRRRRSTK